MPYLVFKVVFSLAVRLDCISAICVRVSCFDLGIPVIVGSPSLSAYNYY